MHAAITAAISGLRWFNPEKSSISSLSNPRRDNSKITPNPASVVST